MTTGPRPARLLPLLDDGFAVDRRAFLADLVRVGALATVVAACGGGGGEPTNPLPEPAPGEPPNLDVTVSLASVPALASVGGVALQGTGRRTFALIRTAQDQFRAFSMVCPHQGSIVGAIRDGGGGFTRFECPNHGATFNTTGANTGGQRTGGLRPFTAAFNAAAGTVRVTGFI
jgi:cytochrome b6-f complex iron-sulfur subunit